MLLDEEFDERVGLIEAALDDNEADVAFGLASRLRLELLEAPAAHPKQLGFARYFVVRSLYHLEKFEEAYKVLCSSEERLYSLTAQAGAWMATSGAELATRLSLGADTVCEWGTKAVDLYEASHDAPNVVSTCNTLCTLLGVMRADEHNYAFAKKLIDLGKAHGSERAVIGGLAHLIRNAESSENAKLKSELEKERGFYESVLLGRHKAEAELIYRQFVKLLAAD
jgi:hypothetical protein